ncbi:MAG: FAD-dependent oxidoreductase [Atopobiaceae bacterium]|nr:FAD-dependent oxidoreductase [Atopobiaceae bacterium]
MQAQYDVVVIGAGVVGAATARELARFDLRILVLEAGLDLACGATRANSGIVHAGYDPLPGTLKAKYNVAGSALFEQWQRELGFGFYRNGALVLAFDEGERQTLDELARRAVANGVKGVCIVEADELRAMEPNVSPDAIAALSVPTSGICDPYGLTYGAAENAASNGVEFEFDARVVGISRDADGFVVTAGDGRGIAARAVVNCAGVHADEMNNLVSERKIHIRPVKGEYLLYHNALAGTFRRSVFQAPSAAGKGVLVSPVIFGNIFVGPNATPVEDKDDLATSEEGQREVLERSRRTWPEATTEQVIATYAGLRAKDTSGADDFVVGEAPDAPGFFNAACIDSPGLTCAPAIATDLARMVAERLGAKENASFDPVRIPAPLLAMMDEASVRELVDQNPLYGVPVCKCCHVSEGELVDALHRALPVRSLDALKWRTGATMGPCHGGRCTARILQIMERELGVAASDVQKRFCGSSLVVDKCADEQRSEELAPHAKRCGELARQARADLDERGMREIGWGALDIVGTRPAGVCSCLLALGLFGTTGCLPGRKAVVWGTHDLALRTTLELADAGVCIERVVEAGDEPVGSPELVHELAQRGIPLQCGTRVERVDGASRLGSVTLACDGASETLTCDLLIASPQIVAE